VADARVGAYDATGDGIVAKRTLIERRNARNKVPDVPVLRGGLPGFGEPILPAPDPELERIVARLRANGELLTPREKCKTNR